MMAKVAEVVHEIRQVEATEAQVMKARTLRNGASSVV